MSKIETTNKVLLKLTSQINLGRRGARAHRALDFGHSPQPPSLPPHSPERAKSAMLGHKCVSHKPKLNAKCGLHES